MLKEKNLIKQIPWEKALLQFIYDERYSALPKQYRKLVYDDFMKTNSVDRIRAEMKYKQEIEEKVRKMMEEYVKRGKIISSTEYKDFELVAKTDPRFQEAIKNDKELVLREFINAIKIAKEECILNKGK